MSARFVYHGLEEFKQALRNLPEDATARVYDLGVHVGDETFADIARGYPERAGKLKQGLTIVKQRSGGGVTITLKNTAKHAWLFDNGSQARHNAIGANRGAMPATHVFGNRMARARVAFYDGAKAILGDLGLRVHGDA